MQTFPRLLVASLVLSTGCYSTRNVTMDELKAKPERVDIIVHTKDSLEYRFDKESYRHQGDSITGVLYRVDDVDQRVAIALADIDRIEATEKDKGRTTLLYIGLGIAIVVPIVMLAVHSFSGIGGSP